MPFGKFFGCGLLFAVAGGWLGAAGSCAAPAARPAEAEVDFTREIRPILAGNCYACHGPDEAKRKAKLRLDVKEEAFKPAKSGDFALVPGDLAKSKLLERVTSPDPDEVMPPAQTGKKLNARQIELLRRWIAQGAPWKKHWAYVPPEHPPLPAVKNKAWPRHELDDHVLARLEREGLRPAPEATRETLIRRLSLDLTGLPPSVAEVEAFRADRRPDAYAQLVERLLASPHYGERWARPWLDQARYADSNGYEADYRRSIWPYRDWVIGALNRDLPFDQFTLEQLAGDLLPDATREQRIATGFHRNTMVNTEGGTDDEEFRVAAIVDRVNTTFSVWLGSTLGCAQCHTHKYDPFTQREYYQVFALFNQTKDQGRSNDPELELPAPEQKAKRDAVQAQLEPLQKQLDTQTPELEAALAQWSAALEQQAATIAAAWTPLAPLELKATGGVTLTRLEDQSVLSGGALPDNSDYEIVVETAATNLTALRLTALVDDRLPQKSSGRSEDGDFVVTDFRVLTPAPTGTTTNDFETAYADHAMDRYDVKAAIDDQPKTGWAIAAHEPANRAEHAAVFVAKQPLRPGANGRLVVRLQQQSDRAQHLLGRFQLAVSSAPATAHDAWGKLPPAARKLLLTPADKRSDNQKKELAKHYRSLDPGLDKLREQIAKLKEQLPKDIPTTLVMEAVNTPRTTHLLIRGSHLNLGDEVTPGVPAALHAWPAGEPFNRLTFARWLTRADNPLLGRVTLNRIWAQYFGIGLVETSEEFGAQGELPANPQVLDLLATEFVRQNYSLKSMHRLIVSSATYRQSSRVTPELARRDPFNRLLARGPRFRMEVEMVRDHALAVSGLLNRKVGGPSVFPYQPDGIWSAPYNGDKWSESTDGDQFRRGLYTFWRRTAPYASFMAFDAPSREVVCERRPRSNTPVQALVTLNDPAFLAPAAALARRVLAEGGGTPRTRLDFAFESCVARRPTRDERTRLLALYERSVKKFSGDAAAAEKLAATIAPAPGDPARRAELAAWTVIANVLLNLDETLTKG